MQQHNDMSYRMCHGFRLTQRDDYLGVDFELGSIFGGSWGILENWLEHKTEPLFGNLACATDVKSFRKSVKRFCLKSIRYGKKSASFSRCLQYPSSFPYTPTVNLINVLCTALTHADPEWVKKTAKSAVSFGAFGTYGCKSCTQNVDESEPKRIDTSTRNIFG